MNDSPKPEQGTDIGSAAHTRSVPRKRTAAAVLFTREDGRVLLCEPAYKAAWELPGGAGELDESPRDTAAREVKEELGLVVEPGRLVVVDYVMPTGTGAERRSEGLCFVFDGGLLGREQAVSIVLDPAEVRSVSWSTVAEVHQRMRPLVARRVEAALEAIGSGATIYMENGYPVGVKPVE